MAKKATKVSKTPAKAKTSGSKGSMSKTELFSILANAANIHKIKVQMLFDALNDAIGSQIGKDGPQQFTIPGVAKIVVKHKPATKARKGISPLTGQEMIFKAKPARNVIKIRPLKKLKEMV